MDKKAYLCIGRDMTEWKQTEQTLRDAKRNAEETSKVKDEFLTNISHELRTPLGSILGLTELTLSSKLTRSQQKNLNNIQTSAEVLLGLINDILDFSKLETGKLKIQTKCFNLLGIMQDVKNSLLFSAQKKRLNFSFSIDELIPEYIYSDPLRLRQIFFNLIGNAIKFTERGYVKASIHYDGSRTVSSPRDIPLHIKIADSGIGIEQKDLRSIFERFTRAPEVSAKDISGTG